MPEGRLIRVKKHDGDAKATLAYLVALSEKDKAIALIRRKAADPEDQVEDLGRVSEALLITLGVPNGEFIKIEGVKHVANSNSNPNAPTNRPHSLFAAASDLAVHQESQARKRRQRNQVGQCMAPVQCRKHLARRVSCHFTV